MRSSELTTERINKIARNIQIHLFVVILNIQNYLKTINGLIKCRQFINRRTDESQTLPITSFQVMKNLRNDSYFK